MIWFFTTDIKSANCGQVIIIYFAVKYFTALSFSILSKDFLSLSILYKKKTPNACLLKKIALRKITSEEISLCKII